MTKLPISAFIICLNEEAYLGNCIESLDKCAEIVVVDSGSTDGTIALLESYIENGWPIRVFHENWRGYAGQKQFALDQCTQPWRLNIDSDERLDAPLRKLLPELIAASEDIVGWRLARRPYLVGYGYTPVHVHERRNLRLIRKVPVKGKSEPMDIYLLANDKQALTDYRPPLQTKTIVARLALRYGSGEWTVDPQASACLIGRDDDCKLKVDHRLVSRRHASVECVAGKFFLQDHSTNGTYIDDSHGGTPTLVQRELYQLKGTGVISLISSAIGVALCDTGGLE